MTSKRPDGRAAFLGTDDIVRRLRETQPSPLGRWGRQLRRAAALVAVVGVSLASYRAVQAWREGDGASNLVTSHVSSPGEDDAKSATDNAAAARATLALGRTRPASASADGARRVSAAAAQVASSMASPGATATARVEVRVVGPAGEVRVLVDGRTVANAGHWSGELPRGPHTVVVRHKFGQQSHALRLQGEGQEVVFDPQGRHVRSRTLHGSSPQGR